MTSCGILGGLGLKLWCKSETFENGIVLIVARKTFMAYSATPEMFHKLNQN